jgi:hypothetical protein
LDEPSATVNSFADESLLTGLGASQASPGRQDQIG